MISSNQGAVSLVDGWLVCVQRFVVHFSSRFSIFLNSGVDWSGSFTYVRMSAITVEITFGGGILLDLLVGAGVSGCCRLWTGNGGGWVRY